MALILFYLCFRKDSIIRIKVRIIFVICQALPPGKYYNIYCPAVTPSNHYPCPIYRYPGGGQIH